MSDGTQIEWTDATVNAVDGCSVASLTEIDCAYIAGLIDGEGSIYVMKHNGRNGQVTYYPAISVMMTTRPVLDWFAGKLGLAVAAVPRSNAAWRDQHSVRIHGKRAVALCARLAPYLKVKQKQAHLLASFPFEDRRGRSPRGRTLAPEIIAQRMALRESVNALNARGAD